jgi:hypothetical protein
MKISKFIDVAEAEKRDEEKSEGIHRRQRDHASKENIDFRK